MKTFASVLAVLALVALPAAFACDKDKNVNAQAAGSDQSGPTREVALTGYLTDSYCGAANANAQGKSCALECVKKGAKVQLYANEKLYTLDQSKVADGHIGVPVRVKGTLDEGTGTIKVASIEVVKQG
ncbi:MAG TPA: hypothetical protein VGV60_03565 [Candidatus Polarisedimenticolia bacterium]|jgi:hypothetical protein|nr:hypothetical protein [Candidatus Polarisedimenticolia bacterium]